MKKNYITPVVRCITFDTEDVMLTGSIGKGDGPLGDERDILSNERESTSSSIWGED